MMIDFFLPMKAIPTVTSQQKGINFDEKRVYTKQTVLDVRQKFLALLAKHRPQTPAEGAVGLLVLWHFPAGKHRDGEWKTSRPDTDNMIKLLKDCMTELGFWKDDAQVCYEVSMKKYAEVSGLYIRVQDLGEEDANA